MKPRSSASKVRRHRAGERFERNQLSAETRRRTVAARLNRVAGCKKRREQTDWLEHVRAGIRAYWARRRAERDAAPM
jgi:hypothetical protein